MMNVIKLLDSFESEIYSFKKLGSILRVLRLHVQIFFRDFGLRILKPNDWSPKDTS